METISHGYGKDVNRWLPLLEIEGKKISSGVRMTFLEMIKCACGNDHTFVGIDTLARRTQQSVRTIQRHIAILKKIEVIDVVEEWVKGWKVKVYYFLKHKVIEEMLASKNNLSRKRGNPPEGDVLPDEHRGKQEFEADFEEKSAGEDLEQERQVGDNLSSILTNRENNGEPPINPPEVEAENSAEETKPKAVWERVCEVLDFEYCFVPQPILQSFTVGENGTVFTVEAPTDFFLHRVKNYRKEIEEEAIKHGFSGVSFGVQPKENLDRRIEEQEQKRRQLLALKQKQAVHKQQVERCGLEEKSVKEQFNCIWKIYPNKSGKWRAFLEFRKAKKQEGTPLVFDMIKLIEKARRTDSWQRENGRFVPSLHRWLNEKRWLDYE